MEEWKPPRYLRDVIKAAYERSSEGAAPTPSTSAEKRLQNVLEALAGLARQCDARHAAYDKWWAEELRKIVEENT